MNEVKFGQAYFEVLSSVKDQVANNLTEACLGMQLDKETIRRIVFVAQNTVDVAGGNGLSSLMKSAK